MFMVSSRPASGASLASLECFLALHSLPGIQGYLEPQRAGLGKEGRIFSSDAGETAYVGQADVSIFGSLEPNKSHIVERSGELTQRVHQTSYKG